MKLPEGFSHVGDGRLSIAEEQLARLKTPRDIGEVYEVEESWIAKGMYGIVREAISKQSGITYAAKFLRRRRRGQCCLNEIIHEIAVLMLCADSDYVVKLQAVHETRSEIALILELATGGELQTLIDEQGHLSEQTTRICMREILRALQHMHSKSIAHLDLKPQNILLAGKSVDDGLKLCDFGIARFIAEKNKIYEIVGTPDYVAPEVLHYDPLSLQTDIWSIGVVAYVLLTGLSPFGGESKQETFLNVTKCSLTFPDELFDGISSDAIDFIKSALRIKPKERLTVDECLEHRWLKEKTVCLREEMLAARATAALNKNGMDDQCTNTLTHVDGGMRNGDCGTTNGGGNGTVLENGNGCQAVRLHESCTNQQQLLVVVDTVSNNGLNITEAPETDTGGGEDDEGGGKSAPAMLNELKLMQRNVASSTATAATDGSTEDNKENVIVGGLVVGTTCSLFPDAPTTPKVSRKTLPVEPLTDGGLHYHNHHHLHLHHHHHLQHHNHHHHHHSNGVNLVLNQSHHVNQTVMLPTPNGGGAGGAPALVSNGVNSPSNALHVSFASRQGSPSCVKKYIQKMHIQQQQLPPLGGENVALASKSCGGDGVLINAPPVTASDAPDEMVEQRANETCCNGTNSSSSSQDEEIECADNKPACSSDNNNSNSCRTTVAAALCALKCTESSVSDGGADSRHLTSPGHKTLQQCDKDAIIC